MKEGVAMPEAKPSFQHNLVSLLYALQGLAESHFARVKEGQFTKEDERLKHAEGVLERTQIQARTALGILKRLEQILRKDRDISTKDLRTSLPKAWQKTKVLLRKEFFLDSIEFIERIPCGFPPIRMPEEALEEVLYAMVRNGVEAMQERNASSEKKLVIRSQVAFSTQEEPFASIAIADTGPGIPPQKLPWLFEPFYTTKPEGRGNGLGLYLARLLVLRNGGKLTVASFDSFGTTFTIELPLAPLPPSFP